MKILFSQVFLGIGGAENYLLALIPALRNRGIDCVFLNIFSRKIKKEATLYEKALVDLGIYVINLEIRSFYSPLLIFKLNNVYKENKITAIHSHLIHSDLLWSLAKKMLNSQIKFFSTKHGYNHDRYVKFALKPEELSRDLHFFLYKFVEKSVTKSYACSYALRDFFVKSGIVKKEQLEVIHHGFDYAEIQKEQIIKLAPKQICVVGRLIKWKGQHLLIDILPDIIARYPNLKVLFIGSGDYQSHLEAMVKQKKLENNIEFLGFKKNIMDYIAGSNINILPSLVESMPLVILEYFNVKIPVITFDILGCGEIVQNNKTGILIPPFDTELLKNKIIEYLENPDEGKKLGENAYKDLKSRFTLDKMVDNTINFYRKF